MDQSFVNENGINGNVTYEIFINYVIIKEMEEITKNNLNVQIETIKNEKKSKEVACSKIIFKTSQYKTFVFFFYV